MGDPARRLAVVRGTATGLAVAAVAAALSHPLTPVVRGVFGHVTTTRVLAIVGLAAAGATVIRLLRRRNAALEIDEGNAWSAWLSRVPVDVALGAIVGLAAGAWFAVARSSHLPSVFGDELVYSGLGKGVARGEGLSLAGTATRGYGIVYPYAISPFYRLTPDGVAAYGWIKATNALAMSLTGVVAYLLARRVVGRGWALAVAALTVAVPAMAYARLVMTEPFAYLTFLVAALTLVWALERPTAARQLVCIAALAVAIGVRVQAFVLVPALVCAVVAFALSAGETRAVLRQFTPTWILLGVGALLAVAAARGHPEDALGSYSVLARRYDVASILKWLAWTTTTLELAAAIVPAFALCIVAPRLLRRAATSNERSIGCVTVSWTIWIVASTTVLSASPYGLDRLHERNLFYVLPLFLTCLAYWVAQGRPRPRRLAVAALVVLATLPLLLPDRLVHTDSAVDAPSLFPWANLDRPLGPLPVQIAMALVVVGSIGWAALSRIPVLPVLLVVVVFYAVIAEAAYREQPVPAAERTPWVDRALPSSSRATLLHVDVGRTCPAAGPVEARLRLTEFFNTKIDRVMHLFADTTGRGLSSPAARVSAGGVLVLGGRPIRPRYVVTETPVRLVGRRLVDHDAAANGLALWEPARPLRLADPWAVAPGGRSSCPLAQVVPSSG
jgi:hypothetical protein